ncbi:MAG: hypothetical protein QOH96_662, partial [Blastocatellia bacterium]|nr:hypothetical protein [Blastocatellia bacterium]
MSIITHIEHFLGQIGDGWKLIEPGYEVNVASFRDKPFEGAITYVTLGLSHHVLAMNPEESVRQELVFTTYEKYSGGEIASFLITFSDFILSKHQALLRGDVVGPGESIIPGCPLKAVYSSMPAVFDDGFAVYKGTSPPTVLVWI